MRRGGRSNRKALRAGTLHSQGKERRGRGEGRNRDDDDDKDDEHLEKGGMRRW